ncbi:hypothetical protein EJ08DRAFT_654567 [Tothia fuscella]|uniref:Uncharacterized protein n=1 Tax=Tothia fuscella TaxID=1048955 RepID=A0A9P4NEL8_9PEZI|nr:hypothetical protein EJ08DRAFT_654567 [Tothia fuscella]
MGTLKTPVPRTTMSATKTATISSGTGAAASMTGGDDVLVTTASGVTATSRALSTSIRALPTSTLSSIEQGGDEGSDEGGDDEGSGSFSTSVATATTSAGGASIADPGVGHPITSAIVPAPTSLGKPVGGDDTPLEAPSTSVNVPVISTSPSFTTLATHTKTSATRGGSGATQNPATPSATSGLSKCCDSVKAKKGTWDSHKRSAYGGGFKLPDGCETRKEMRACFN